MAGKKVTKPLYTQEEINQLYESAMTNYLNEKVYGVVPHDLMHMNLNLAPLAAAGAGAAAMVGRAGNNLYKKLTTKAGAKKVYREIERLGAYIMKGEYAEKYKIQIRLRDGGKKNTIKSYDQIVDKFKETIKKDVSAYIVPNNNDNNEDIKLQTENIDKATVYYLIKKYDTLFKELGKEFPDLNNVHTASTKDIDIAEQIKDVCERNLQYADRYIEKLIDIFEKKFTIKGIINKEKEGNADRVQKWSMILKAAWENVKKDIREYYSGLPKDIAKTTEFVALTKLIDELYKKLPSINNDVGALQAKFKNALTKACGEYVFKYDVKAVNNGTDDYQTIYIANDDRHMDNKIQLGQVKETIDIDEILAAFNKQYKTNYQYTDSRFYYVRAIGPRPAPESNEHRKTEMFQENDRDRFLYTKSIKNTDPDLKNLNGAMINDEWMNDHCGIALIIKIVNRSNYNNQSAKISVAAECKWSQETINLPTPQQNNQQNNNQQNKQNPAPAAPSAAPSV